MADRWRTKAGPKWLAMLVSVLVSAILSVVVAEGAIRIADPFHGEPGVAMYHPVRGDQLVPGFRGRYRAPVYVDDLGFRDYDRRPPLTKAKPPGVTRVMVFGDSFAFGDEFPIESSFVYQMEQRLRALDPARHWEVINAGVPGYNSIEEDLYVREAAVAFSADLVVLDYTMNDSDDYHPPPPFTGFRAAIQPLVDWIRTHSYLYNLLYVDVPRIRGALSATPQRGGGVDWTERYSETSRHYQAMRGALMDIDRYLGEDRIPLIVLVYGLGPEAVAPDSPPPGDQLLRDYPLAPMHRTMRTLIERDLHARYIDALDLIGSMTQREVYEGTGHPGARANAAVASALAACALDVAGGGLKPAAQSSPCAPTR